MTGERMTTDQKMLAMVALDYRTSVMLSPYTKKWYVSCRAEVKEGSIVSSPLYHSTTAEQSIRETWEEYSKALCVVVNVMKKNRREVRWNGFMWDDV